MDRIGIITDPHGCFKTYVALKRKVRKQFPGLDFSISGDINDRGKGTRELINHVLDEKDGWVKGNHEDLMGHWPHIRGRWVTEFDAGYDVWLYNGGYDTLISYGYDPYERVFEYEDEFIQHQKLMRSLPLYKEYDIKDEEGRTLLVTHSSAQKVWKWDAEKREKQKKQFEAHLIWERNPNPKVIPGVFNVFGHTPHYNRVKDHYANIDTGCAYNQDQGFGVLSCFVWPDKVLIQQPNIE